MDCIEHCEKARANISACATCTAQEKLDQICRQVPAACPNSPVPITCDRADCTNPACLVYREARDRFITGRPLMIWAESGRRVLHPVMQAEVERRLADDARQMNAERNAFSYLTADEGNPWGSHEGL